MRREREKGRCLGDEFLPDCTRTLSTPFPSADCVWLVLLKKDPLVTRPSDRRKAQDPSGGHEVFERRGKRGALSFYGILMALEGSQ